MRNLTPEQRVRGHLDVIALLAFASCATFSLTIVAASAVESTVFFVATIGFVVLLESRIVRMSRVLRDVTTKIDEKAVAE